MHKFDLNGWRYGESRIEDLAEQVRRHVPGATLPTHLGGKAFGLSLAQVLCGDVFTIPEWDAVTHEQSLPGDFQDKHFQGAFVRSNAPGEDWGDPRAGLHESKYRSFAYGFQNVVDQLLVDCGGVVVQAHAYGVGVVIDLGWSELLNRNVLRVAIGGPSQQGGRTVYTSPTWDNEAAVGLFDAHTGEAIVDLQPHSFDLRRVVDKMVKSVVPRLMEWNIDFGLQFEFMAELNDMRDRMLARLGDRYQPHDNLVQVRPSPGALQGTAELPTPSGNLVVTTGKVNQPGSVVAELFLVGGPNVRDLLETSRNLHIAGEYGTDFNELEPIKPLIAGKIILWDMGALERYGGSFFLRGGSRRWSARGHWS
ncbi:MAG: hypothetical protein UY76_C0010G0002 [Candidatus Uhrbacteria bacterium GW2011_GWA2_52_8d]|uniref:Uncharacterized protein n=1 Tax=Candidatus Uhrbacteria bacterium GW2011_GWA2_52_8d TaxID=1618979 RepID=A0A0G1XQ92_9BACT|nr:MAG: hypothetical protein UY76_C0010G0002 [Candidatus Uhrbacteria bacterium GW2011_GWA2_52_8d]